MRLDDERHPRRLLSDWVRSRNDRYLTQFVERFEVCPFAAKCRTDGKLRRKMTWLNDPQDITRATVAVEELEALNEAEPVEVALLVCAGLRGLTVEQFATFHEGLRAAYQRRFDAPAFYVVPFHPEQRAKVHTASGLVPFWRRSPEPTLQFVSVSLLHRIRRGDHQRDPSHLALQLAAAGLPPEEILARLERQPNHLATSERVAQANLKTFQAHEQALEEVLRELTNGAPPVDADARWADSEWEVVG